MKRLILIFILPFLLSSFAEAQNGRVTGRVTDQETGKGLPYVYVQAKGADGQVIITGLTDADGHFSLQGLGNVDGELVVSSLGYYPALVEIKAGRVESGDLKIGLNPALIPIGEVQVSSLRYQKLEKDVALPITVVPREYFPRQSSMTLSDVLAQEPGIALVRDGAWGTSLNVRGLGENRMVLLVDGDRIETASDLVAGLSMFDVNEIERVEVIKGAASSIYGTGALGGVVNIITRKGQYFDQPGIHGSAMGTYQTVNNLLGTHLALETGSKKWRVRLSGGYQTAGNYRTPDGIQPNSQFRDQDFNATVGIRPFKNHELEINAQDYQAFDVGIPGGAPFGPLATATYPQEKRQLLSGKYTIRGLLPSMEEISLRAYHQYILRDVEMMPNTPATFMGSTSLTAEKVLPKGDHKTNGVVLETKWTTGARSRLVGGIDLWQRRLSTAREKYIRQDLLDPFGNVLSSQNIVRTEQPNPNSRFGSAGLFLQEEWNLLDDKLDLTLGARIDRIRVTNETDLDPVSVSVNGVFLDPVPAQRIVYPADTTGSWSWSANAGALYHLFPHVDVTANLGRSFRSPSLEERFKYIDLGSKVRLGDPNLKPEQGLFGDVGFRIWGDRLQVQANGFINYLNDMIVEVPGIFVYTLNTGPDAGLTDTLPALKNANVERALLTGFDASVNVQVVRNVLFFARAAYVNGYNMTQKGSLPQIPPFSGAAGFRYSLPGTFAVEWTTNWVGARSNVATGETGTDSYFLSNLSLFSDPWKAGIASFQLFAGVDNIFNASYRNFLATNRGMILVEPGRNVFLKLVMKF